MELQTNLLPLLRLPSQVCYGDTNIPGYLELRQLLDSFKLRCCLHGGKLVFLGSLDPVLSVFEESSKYHLKNTGIFRLNNEVLSIRREVIIPILYDVVAAFLGYKGLRHVPNYRGHLVYMVDHESLKVTKYPQKTIFSIEGFKNRKNRTVKSHSNHTGPYVHEGFEYQLEFIGSNLYLALIPRIVLTTDKEQVMVFEDANRMYTSLNAYRWNKELRWLLNVWAIYLGIDSPSGTIAISTTGGEQLVFSSFYAKIQGE